MNQEFVNAVTLLVEHAEKTGEGRALAAAAALVRDYILAETVEFISEDEELDIETKRGLDTK